MVIEFRRQLLIYSYTSSCGGSTAVCQLDSFEMKYSSCYHTKTLHVLEGPIKLQQILRRTVLIIICITYTLRKYINVDYLPLERGSPCALTISESKIV